MKTLTPRAKARYFRRQATDLIMGGLCVFAAVIGIVLLGLILWMLFSRGLGGLSLDVFTKPMASSGAGGGLANAIVGSLIQVGIGSAIGAPLGMMVGVYLSEVGKTSRFASVVRFVNDILLSAPSVLVGLFVYQIAVSPFGGFSGIAGAIALTKARASGSSSSARRLPPTFITTTFEPVHAGACAKITPCSTPSGPLRYHSSKPSRCNRIRFPAASIFASETGVRMSSHPHAVACRES